MADWNYTTRPTEPGRYAVLAQLDDGTLVEQVETWSMHGGPGGWWGDGRCGAEEQPGTVIAWREIES